LPALKGPVTTILTVCIFYPRLQFLDAVDQLVDDSPLGFR
jgi:hypothetical protein